MRVTATTEERILTTHFVPALWADSVGKVHLKNMAAFRARAATVEFSLHPTRLEPFAEVPNALFQLLPLLIRLILLFGLYLRNIPATLIHSDTIIPQRHPSPNCLQCCLQRISLTFKRGRMYKAWAFLQKLFAP